METRDDARSSVDIERSKGSFLALLVGIAILLLLGTFQVPSCAEPTISFPFGGLVLSILLVIFSMLQSQWIRRTMIAGVFLIGLTSWFVDFFQQYGCAIPDQAIF